MTHELRVFHEGAADKVREDVRTAIEAAAYSVTPNWPLVSYRQGVVSLAVPDGEAQAIDWQKAADCLRRLGYQVDLRL